MDEKPLLPAVPFKMCPIQTSLGVLGKKWTMLILRDIAFLKVDRFNQILRTIPGLTPRVLSMRLRELDEAGIICQVENRRSPKLVRWALTEKGEDTVPIMMSFIEYGSRWHADQVFEDGMPRKLREVFPDPPFQGSPRSGS